MGAKLESITVITESDTGQTLVEMHMICEISGFVITLTFMPVLVMLFIYGIRKHR